MKYYFLQSGSAGNSCLIVTKDSKILIDVGLTYSCLKDKLKILGYSITDIDAFLITHEHGDHIKGIQYIPYSKVYATKETLSGNEFHDIEPYKMFEINNTHIVPLTISHDIRNGVGYVIDDENQRLVYMTDTGKVLVKNRAFMKDADHYCIESNHNLEMLMNCPYPDFLKIRISSDKGHLSNEQSGKLMGKLIGKNTKTITLAHISEKTNTPDLALKDFKEQLDLANIDYSNIRIKAADRYEITIGEDND